MLHLVTNLRISSTCYKSSNTLQLVNSCSVIRKVVNCDVQSSCYKFIVLCTIVMLYGAVILSDFKVVVLCCGGIIGSKYIVL